jgi:hypothetical protein
MSRVHEAFAGGASQFRPGLPLAIDSNKYATQLGWTRTA